MVVEEPDGDGEAGELPLVPPEPLDELSAAGGEVEAPVDVALDDESLPVADPLLPRESVR